MGEPAADAASHRACRAVHHRLTLTQHDARRGVGSVGFQKDLDEELERGGRETLRGTPKENLSRLTWSRSLIRPALSLVSAVGASVNFERSVQSGPMRPKKAHCSLSAV